MFCQLKFTNTLSYNKIGSRYKRLPYLYFAIYFSHNQWPSRKKRNDHNEYLTSSDLTDLWSCHRMLQWFRNSANQQVVYQEDHLE